MGYQKIEYKGDWEYGAYKTLCGGLLSYHLEDMTYKKSTHKFDFTVSLNIAICKSY